MLSMSEAGERYAVLMAPAWETGLADVRDITAMDVPPIVKWATCQQRVQTELEKVDWESTDLPAGPAQKQDENQIGERMPSRPREQARRFLSFNFDDAFKIMTLAAETAAENDIPIGNDFAEVLKHSKRSLLLLSRLEDPNKTALLRAIQYQHEPYVVEAYGGPIFTGKPIVFAYSVEDREPVFDWAPEIRQWISERLDPQRGCPANGILTKTEPKMPLTFFFWDSLATAMFQQLA